ncbi:uncharacterized protein SPSK_04682 [Sporothrix schenckii 1099-18]|uniref:Uncharacterized protein n=1 Tax=Sporothrix schenckii 1099-18 TaxID=1397361 RepID=A0A0F2M5U2_SPOSC|nr:uncharacterized protein SPSK_04682 [Sporothrix schenckii 1099-18]KJR83551.1 hypothetical protein SPSK_04682 [Sporothrix schenckii 1099-18]
MHVLGLELKAGGDAATVEADNERAWKKNSLQAELFFADQIVPLSSPLISAVVAKCEFRSEASFPASCYVLRRLGMEWGLGAVWVGGGGRGSHISWSFTWLALDSILAQIEAPSAC